MISLFDIIYSGIFILSLFPNCPFVEMYMLISPKSPPFLYPNRNLTNSFSVNSYIIFPFLYKFSIVWNNKRIYVILNTLNLGCSFITRREPCNNQRPTCRCHIARPKFDLHSFDEFNYQINLFSRLKLIKFCQEISIFLQRRSHWTEKNEGRT
jgi:hypothetical protein